MKRRRPKQRHLAFSALEVADLDMFRMLLAKESDLAHVRDLNGITLLRAAVFHGRQDMVEMLLETAGPIDAFDAASLGRTERLAEVLDAGETSPEDQSPEGYGLLHLACFFGHADTAAMLLDRGASVNAVSKHRMGALAQHSAAASRHWDLVTTLLDRGADVGAKQAGGWTLLHHAAQQGDREQVESLLERGAEPAVKNDRGQSPADVARGLGHDAIAERLEAV